MSSAGGRGSAPAPQAPRPGWGVRTLVSVTGAVLLIYGVLALFVASAWGPGNSDELVHSGPALIPWYGLSAVGTLAAAASLAFVTNPRVARWALLAATTSLIGWTAFLVAGTD